MALRTRRAYYGVGTGVDARELAPASALVASCTGVDVPPNKAIVGRNAFAHEAGIHQDGVLKHRETYEIMTPESVGVACTSIVLGKHSGRRAVRQRLGELGIALEEPLFLDVFEQFKALADRKKRIDDRDLAKLALL
ncbi:2-isopropylmalate synthase, partial [Bradyrhizobium sp. NBAIM08]|nr:2-isopropylmalate synthase [Bradyrhizobium sp. NBAIM08]